MGGVQTARDVRAMIGPLDTPERLQSLREIADEVGFPFVAEKRADTIVGLPMPVGTVARVTGETWPPSGTVLSHDGLTGRVRADQPVWRLLGDRT